MNLGDPNGRILATYARLEAFAPQTVSILAKLGYRIVLAEELATTDAHALLQPDMRIVDERRLGEIPEEDGEAPIPMVLLTGRHGVSGVDPRIAGAVKRPAGMHDLYRLLQQVFEETPRSTPRVPTHLRAQCKRGGREWGGAVLSLSMNGCLLRSAEPLPLGTQLELCFQLPKVGEVALWAETAYQLVPDVGLVFSALAASDRDAISSFVTATLSAA